MNKISKKVITLLTALLMTLTSACGSTNPKMADKSSAANVQTPPAVTAPVTLKFFNYGASVITQQDLDDFMAPVKSKYPNISFEMIPSQKGSYLPDLVNSGNIPDIITSSNYYMYTMKDLGVLSDLSDFVKGYNVDLNRFTPGLFDVIKQFSPDGKITAIPYAMNYGVMVYNKDIFDHFGVSYPKDNMTISQVIDLAKKVTRKDNLTGTQTIGFDPSGVDVWSRAYSLSVTDQTGKNAILNSEGYVKIFSLLKQVYDIPGIVSDSGGYKYGMDFFMKNKQLAMFPYWLNNLTSNISKLQADGDNQLNWDIVSEPSFDDKPGLGRVFDFHLMVVPPTSKNRDAAYQVINTLISDEAQQSMDKKKLLTILNDPKLKLQYASDLNIYKGKNLAGVFKVNPAPAPIATKYDSKMYSILNDELGTMVTKHTDINTVLRDANEQANKYIQENP